MEIKFLPYVNEIKVFQTLKSPSPISLTHNTSITVSVQYKNL